MATRQIVQYLRPYRGKIAALALLMLSGMGLQLLVPQIVRRFIDVAAFGGEVAHLVNLALLFLGVGLLNQILGALSTYLSADIGWGATNALRTYLFRHTLYLDMRYHKERSPGELIERIDGDVTHLSNFLSQFVVRVAGSLLLVIGILTIIWREDWRAGLTLTTYALIVGGVLLRRRAIAIPATELERESNAQLFGFIEERVAGLDDIRANGAGAYVMSRLTAVQRDWYLRGLLAWRLRSGIWTSMMILFSAGTVITLALGVGLFSRGLITLGTVYLFFNYMTMLEAPLDEITRQLQEFQKAGASLRRVREMLAEERDVLDGHVVIDPGRAHRLEFVDVRFAYEEQDVLKGISFTLEPGETLGLLGRTGSGKSTLTRLIFRLHDATGGTILLDGVDLRDTELKSLRSSIGFVTQDVQLFQGSIRENLTFFDPTVSDARLMEVLADLGLSEWIAAQPAGLETQLQAGGAGLSAGESQLLALARVFLQNPGLVILDEASSRLDPKTERLLTRAFQSLLTGRTGIVIAHRLETVAHVDKIMVLSDGRIVELGDREELARSDSVYRAMLQAARGASMDEELERLGV